jgi:predicted Zn-ribbon and HTH transcriptional regulator
MKKLTHSQFIEKFNQRYSDNLGLDLTHFEYISMRSFSITKCLKHNTEILNSANNLMQGIKRCTQCKSEAISNSQLYTIDHFIANAENHHGKKYNYSFVEYTGIQNKVKIICDEHGEFFQTPELHMNGFGCNKCGYINLRKSTSDFIKEAVNCHGNQYDYSLVNYKNNYSDVKIKCKIHGEFMIEPKSHLLFQRGCPQCYLGNRSWIETKWLDQFNIPEENRQVPVILKGRRFLVDAKIGNTIYEFWGDFWHGNPNKFLAESRNTKCGKTFGELYNKTLEKRVLILNAGYILKEIWEDEFMKQLKQN